MHSIIQAEKCGSGINFMRKETDIKHRLSKLAYRPQDSRHAQIDTGKCETQQKEVVDTMETEVRIMGVQRIQETSAASYGKSVEAATTGDSSAAGSGSATGGTTQTVENITTPWKAENKNSTDTKNSLSARNDKDEEQETLVGAGNNTQIRKAVEVFGIHDATNRVMIKIVDKDTKEVLKEYPPEKTLDMIAKVWEVAGLLVDEKM